MATEFSWSSLLDLTGVAGILAAIKAIRHSGEQSAKVDEIETRVAAIESMPDQSVAMARHDERIKTVEKAVENVGAQLAGINRSVANLEANNTMAASDRAEILRKLDRLQGSRS